MTSFLQNVTDKPDVSENDIFDMKKCHFRQICEKPLGLDKGFGALSRKCPTVVSGGVTVVSKRHFRQKPLGLDKGFDENG